MSVVICNKRYRLIKQKKTEHTVYYIYLDKIKLVRLQLHATECQLIALKLTKINDKELETTWPQLFKGRITLSSG